MDEKEYFSELNKKYAAIERHKFYTPPTNTVKMTLGDELNIKSGPVTKQLKKSVIDRADNEIKRTLEWQNNIKKN